MKKSSSFFQQKGVTIIELMVAVLIGLLSMYAVYRVYEGTERAKRNIVAVGDAQVSGLYSIFLLEQDIKSAGSGMMLDLPVPGVPSNAQMLDHCAPGAGNMGGVTSPAQLTLRPLPVVINALADFDEVYTFSGSASRHVIPVPVQAVTPQGGGYNTTIVTPFGFNTVNAGAAGNTGDVLVDVRAGAAGTACQAYLVAAPQNVACTPPFPAIPTSCTVTASLQGAVTPVTGDQLINLGTPVRHRFYVDPANNTLLMEDWRLGSNGTWTLNRVDPIITGVAAFRAQYGIGNPSTPATTGRPINSPISQWVSAVTGAATPSWDMTTVLSAPWATIQQIKAVRLSLIVQADEPDNTLTVPMQFTQFNNCPGLPAAQCPAPIVLPSFPVGLRYRMYETVIPLENTIWNP